MPTRIATALLAVLATASPPRHSNSGPHLGGVDPMALVRTLDGLDYLGGHPFVIREFPADAKNKATCEQLGGETVMKLGELPAKNAKPQFDSVSWGDQVLAVWTIDSKLHLREGDDKTTAALKSFDVMVLCREPDSVGFYVFGRATDRACRGFFVRMTREGGAWMATNVRAVIYC